MFVLLGGLVFTLPNFFGEAPAVQISVGKATMDFDAVAITDRAMNVLKAAGIEYTGIFSDATGVRFRFADIDTQKLAKEAIENEFNPDKQDTSYVVALNMLPNSPGLFTRLNIRPMNRGLDLRGGVHFLLEVDLPGAIDRRLNTLVGDLSGQLRGKVRHSGITRQGDTIVLRFTDAAQRDTARATIRSNSGDIQLADRDAGDKDFWLVASLSQQTQQSIRESAIHQNINTLHNRINELGVAEPVIQQQGMDRIVVQLPGVQDTATAKDILGRTATLELRMVEGAPGDITAFAVAMGQAQLPYGTELYFERTKPGQPEGIPGKGIPLLLRKQIELTGENLVDAQAGFDENHEPAVHLNLDGTGARKFRDLTRQNVGKHMAIVLVEKNKGEVVTAPVIRTEISGGRVQISGAMKPAEASKTALLLRAGSLAAPMQIIEERTIGPSLGADNIEKGFNSTLWGFIVIVVFMCVYYALFGVVSSLALTANLLLLVALLSMLQATLTLPGIAAMALTLGMAIDSNVLINERIREELRNNCTPQMAITAGYDRAWDTILDSNITTLIAGIALLVFGSGPVRGFAVVHCLGILTSMFSAILVSRMLINYIYGHRRKLDSISIGKIWKPGNH
ncbi:MAG: protein translocase subunit SecD [Azoarcus sp.]|nr:protein translocase subunit SecD [Azoarcus sp.]